MNAQAATEAVQPASTQADPKRQSGPARKPLPEDLPREVVTHLPAHNCCPECGGALRQFGEDVSEKLERVPASFKVIRHVRTKFACAGCEIVVEAPEPDAYFPDNPEWNESDVRLNACACDSVQHPRPAFRVNCISYACSITAAFYSFLVRSK